jgi:signal transduction histidine kinase
MAPDIVLQEMDDPVFVLDEDDVVVGSNPAADPLLGTSTTPVGTHIDDVLPGLLDASANDEQFRLADGELQSDGGTAAVYDLNHAPVEDQYGLDRGSVIVLREITVQKQRERTIEGLQSVSQEFLVAEDKDEVFERAVRTAETILGYPYAGALSYDDDEECLRPVAFTDTLEAGYDEADIDPVVEPGENDIWQVFERNEPLVGESPTLGISSDDIPVSIRHTLLLPLGEHGVLGISGGPDHEGFSEDDQRFARALATTTENALDRVQKEVELRESRELVQQRTDQIEFFNGVLRHDLINSMTIIQSTATQLEGTVDGTAAEQVATIREYSDDIMTLAQKVRSITRTVSDDRNVELEPVDLGAAVDRKARKLEESHEDVTVRIDVSLDALERVSADELLPEVIENLLLNAVEHNDTETPEIRVDVEDREESVALRIADNGPGIPDEQKEEIFEERITSDGSGSIGFGLYFVRVMVDRYGGSIHFEDNEPRGAVAVLELPLAPSLWERSQHAP